MWIGHVETQSDAEADEAQDNRDISVWTIIREHKEIVKAGSVNTTLYDKRADADEHTECDEKHRDGNAEHSVKRDKKKGRKAHRESDQRCAREAKQIGEACADLQTTQRHQDNQHD